MTRRQRRTGVDRRTFLKASSAAALSAAATAPFATAAGSRRGDRPNILLIITDQQHAHSVCAGNGNVPADTPAMDQLVESGTSFHQSYTSNPVCSPARSSLLTGRASSETGVYTNSKPIRSTIPNLGQWLGEKAGYETLYAGKWHLPASYSASIPGFRVLHTGIGGQGNLCDSAVSMACDGYLRNRKRDKPFLMVASFMQPHDICEWLRLDMNVPEKLRYPELADKLPPLPKNFKYDPAEPQMVRDTRRGNEPAKGKWTERHWRYYRWSYFRHVEMVDGEIGRLLACLDETGQDEDTLVLLTSDHGEGMGHHQMVRKSSPYDEASKVPLLAAWPGGDIASCTIDDRHLVSGMDIMPTLCDYAGAKSPPKMRGENLRPLLEGKPVEWDRFTVTELQGDCGRMLRTRDFKYVTYRGDSVDQLFDMKHDPGETQNLAKNPHFASTVAEHRALLKKWESRLDVAPNVPKSDAWWRSW